MRFARWTFLIAGLYGILILMPGFFLEAQLGEREPPPITHPEFYYGFYGSALVWQLVFFLIAGNPLKYRPLMLVSVLEKVSFFATCIVLFLTGRLAVGGPLLGSIIDGLWMVLFTMAWRRTGTAVQEATRAV
jgi:hypothetical protein